MTKETIFEELTSVLRNVFEVWDLTITREMTAHDVERWDSLRHIQLIAAVEKAFGVKFKLREVLSMKNVGDLIDLVYTKSQ